MQVVVKNVYSLDFRKEINDYIEKNNCTCITKLQIDKAVTYFETSRELLLQKINLVSKTFMKNVVFTDKDKTKQAQQNNEFEF